MAAPPACAAGPVYNAGAACWMLYIIFLDNIERTDMNINNENDEIAEELRIEKEARMLAEFAPKKIQRIQVSGAKFAWMAVAIAIDLVTAYAYMVILAPYWWYGIAWIIAGAGGLIFSEWLWERVGNNAEQTRISSTSKNVSAISVLVMALFTGVALIMEWQGEKWIEILSMFSAVLLVCFHGWQSYQYHENDDEYKAENEASIAEAAHQKELRAIHRAGRTVAAKRAQRRVGGEYQDKYGKAFVQASGRSFGAETEEVKHIPNSQGGERK